MQVLSTVVADIRPATRETLVRSLRENDRFAITGVFSTWDAGLAAVGARAPRVAFLPLPEPADAPLLRALAAPDGPALVLIGSRPEEATRAFDLGALDYLVRPPRPGRVDRSLETLSGALASSTRSEWWPFRSADGEFLLPLADVRRLEATRGGTTVHTTTSPHRTSTPFEPLAASLAARGFVLVSPVDLVRGDAVRELRQVTHDTWDVVLEGGDHVRSASSERDAIETLMETLGELAIH